MLQDVWKQVTDMQELLINAYKTNCAPICCFPLIDALNTTMRARRNVFFDCGDLSLYERSVVIANSYLTLHNFVIVAFYEGNFEKLSNPVGHLIENLIKHYDIDDNDNYDIKKNLNIDVRRKMEVIERILTKVLLKEYKFFKFFSPLKMITLKLHPTIQNEIKLCIKGDFETLDEISKRRRKRIINNNNNNNNKKLLQPILAPAIGSVGFIGNIEREIRLCNDDNYVITFSPVTDKSIVNIFNNNKNLGSKYLESKIHFENVLIPNRNKDYNFIYSLRILNFKTDLLFFNQQKNEEKKKRKIKMKKSSPTTTTTTETRNGGKELLSSMFNKRMELLYDLYFMEDFGQMMKIPITKIEEEEKINNISLTLAQDANENVKEVMAIEELSRVVNLTNRGVVEFVGSRYDYESDANTNTNSNKIVTLKFNSNMPIKLCRLTKIPKGSKMGFTFIDTPDNGMRLYPSPLDFMTCLMVHLILGNKNINFQQDFVTLKKQITLRTETHENVSFNGTRRYARVMLIPPSQVNELEIDNGIKTVEEELKKIVLKFGNERYFLLDLKLISAQLCQPKEGGGISPILTSMLRVNIEKYNLAKDVLQIITKNTICATHYMRGVVASIFQEFCKIYY